MSEPKEVFVTLPREPLNLSCNGGDWFAIQRGWADINGASIEGTAADMLALADAIESRGFVSCGRCAVDARGEPGHPVEFWSPRNSITHTFVAREEAEALAKRIRERFRDEGERLAVLLRAAGYRVERVGVHPSWAHVRVEAAGVAPPGGIPFTIGVDRASGSDRSAEQSTPRDESERRLTDCRMAHLPGQGAADRRQIGDEITPYTADDEPAVGDEVRR